MEYTYRIIHKTNKKSRNINVFCIIPCFYEHLTISNVINRLRKLFDDHVFILVVVSDENDPSIKKAIESNADLIILNEKRGYGLAILTGLDYLSKHYNNALAMIIDADDTYRPSKTFAKFVRYLSKVNGDYLVVGKRILKNQSMPLLNRLGNILVNKLITLLGGPRVNDSQTGLKVFPIKLYKSLKEKGMTLSEEILLNSWYLGYKMIELPVVYEKRNSHSDSKLNIVLDGLNIIKLTITKVPLLRLRRYK